MQQIIIHVDMDAFYAAVETRDNPALAGLPLIIGALPQERGVVSTCSYEARRFGVHSGMSIKDAYRLCPQGTYMHPDMSKYKKVSAEIHEVWKQYTDRIEYLSLDEGYLDVSGSAHIFSGAVAIAKAIKAQTKERTGLTCSVGIGYSMMSAKLGSEERKPDGLFEIPDVDVLLRLIIGRETGVLPGIGRKTAEKLQNAGIQTVRDIRRNQQKVLQMLGKNGRQVVEMANGIDRRRVTPYYEAEAKSIGRECTFQQDTADFVYLASVLLLLCKELSLKLRLDGLYAQTVTLKLTYGNMKQITRSKSGDALNRTDDVYRVAAALLGGVEKKPVRLVGISLGSLTRENIRQLSLEDIGRQQEEKRKEALDDRLLSLQRKYGADIIKTGIELKAEKNVKTKDGSS